MSIYNGSSVDLYFSSIGICHTIEKQEIMYLNTYKKKGGDRKVLNLNPVPRRRVGMGKKHCLYNEQSEISLG